MESLIDTEKLMLDSLFDSLLIIEPQWIPVSERLPENSDTVIVSINGKVDAGYYSNDLWWCIGDSLNLEVKDVDAWMPLPNPYEVEE